MSSVYVRTSAHARARWNGGHILESSEATFKGTCMACGHPYVPGDFIKSLGKGQGASHDTCPAKGRARAKQVRASKKPPTSAQLASRAQVSEQIRAWGSRTTP